MKFKYKFDKIQSKHDKRTEVSDRKIPIIPKVIVKKSPNLAKLIKPFLILKGLMLKTVFFLIGSVINYW